MPDTIDISDTERKRLRNERACRGRDRVNPDRRRKQNGIDYRGEVGIICYRCRQDLPLDRFRPAPRNKYGVDTTCKDRTRLRRYGITILDYRQMVDDQGGLCLVCGVNEATDVDHCHDSGAIRGILCATCNRGLGFFGDNPEGLRKALEYLEAHYGSH